MMLLEPTLNAECTSPPGNTILDILDERELSVEAFAQSIGITSSKAQNLIEGKLIITNSLAQDLADNLGASANFWLAREYDYRASIESPEDQPLTSDRDFIKKFPVKDMVKYDWIRAEKKIENSILECFEFFGVSSLAQWQGRYENEFTAPAYRKSKSHNNCEFATLAWLRKGELETINDEVRAWSPDVLENLVSGLMALISVSQKESITSPGLTAAMLS